MSSLLGELPSTMVLRAKLEEMVANDLLGPAGGPNEELTERNVRDRYLVLSFPSSSLGTQDLRGSGLATCPEPELRRSSVPKPELGNQSGGR